MLSGIANLFAKSISTACWYFVFSHLFDGDVLVLCKILFVLAVFCKLCKGGGICKNKQKAEKQLLVCAYFHIFVVNHC